ncbi:MAG: nucleotidyltransferase domain-containing protein [Ginsengibacter sp.]
MLYDEKINALISEIVSGYQPEKIYLFGSYANGKQNFDSDIDLFIVKDTRKRKLDRNREVRKCIKTYPDKGLDVFVFTPGELEEGMQEIMNIGKEAVNTGKLVYERI